MYNAHYTYYNYYIYKYIMNNGFTNCMLRNILIKNNLKIKRALDEISLGMQVIRMKKKCFDNSYSY